MQRRIFLASSISSSSLLIAGCSNGPSDSSPESQIDTTTQSRTGSSTQSPTAGETTSSEYLVDSLPRTIIDNTITANWEANVEVKQRSVLLAEAVSPSPLIDSVPFSWASEGNSASIDLSEDRIYAKTFDPGEYTLGFLIERDGIDESEVRVRFADSEQIDPDAVNLPDSYHIFDVDSLPRTLIENTIDDSWRSHIRLHVDAKAEIEVIDIEGPGDEVKFSWVDVSSDSGPELQDIDSDDNFELDVESGKWRFGFLLTSGNVEKATVRLSLVNPN